MQAMREGRPAGVWRDVPTKEFADLVTETLRAVASGKHADFDDTNKIVTAAIRTFERESP